MREKGATIKLMGRRFGKGAAITCIHLLPLLSALPSDARDHTCSPPTDDNVGVGIVL